MRFTVETWAPEYGAAVDDLDLVVAEADVVEGVELDPGDWVPIDPLPSDAERPRRLVFLDGVRRIDARVWIGPAADGTVSPGVCASWAAGAVVVEDGRARVETVVVDRGVFTQAAEATDISTANTSWSVRTVVDDSPEGLALAVQERMLALEARLAGELDGDLVIVDGPLKEPHPPELTVGHVKTHHRSYLSSDLMKVVGSLEPGQRSPVFVIGAHGSSRFPRYSWYVRLPGPRIHPLAGVVRCDQHGDRPSTEAIRRADVVTTLLPSFASEPHKDPRAPQNLYPVAGLERELRRRLGDPRLLELSLRRAAGI